MLNLLNKLYAYKMNNDCIFCIFTMLSVSDIVNCLYVCKRFYTIAKNNLLWKQLFKDKVL